MSPEVQQIAFHAAAIHALLRSLPPTHREAASVWVGMIAANGLGRNRAGGIQIAFDDAAEEREAGCTVLQLVRGAKGGAA